MPRRVIQAGSRPIPAVSVLPKPMPPLVRERVTLRTLAHVRKAIWVDGERGSMLDKRVAVSVARVRFGRMGFGRKRVPA